MKNTFLILILICLNSMFGIASGNLGFLMNKDSDVFYFSTNCAFLGNQYSEQLLGTGVYYYFGGAALTGEYYYKTSFDDYRCSYLTFKAGVTTESEFLTGLDYTLNPFFFNLRLNIFQVRVKNGEKPVFEAGMGCGIGIPLNIFEKRAKPKPKVKVIID